MNYYSLPEKYHVAHATCWSLVEQIEDFIINKNFNGLRMQAFEGLDLSKDEHPFDALLRNEMQKEHDDLVKKQVLNGLLIDICYFLQEALVCSTKKRLTVAMALIRKPFVYNLLVILRMTFDADFIENFNNNEGYDPTSMDVQDKKTLLEWSTKVLILSKSLTKDEIFDYIFSREGDSIMNMSDKALHLSTTRNTNNLSGKQNFNYLFATSDNIEQLWGYLYRRLPALLLYLNEVIDFAVFTSLKIDDSIKNERFLRRGEILKNYADKSN